MKKRPVSPFDFYCKKTSVCFDKDVRSFSIKHVRSFSVSRKYSRVRELYMECDFDLLMLNAVICAILFDWLSDIYELITEKVSKKFRGMLVGSAKVCTFASAFEREMR